MPETIARNTVGDLTEDKLLTDSRDRLFGKPTKYQIAAWGMLVLIGIGLSLSNYDSFPVGWWRDDQRFVILAQSLVHAKQYGLFFAPGEVSTLAPYPFAYPLVLAPFVALFPGNLAVLKIPSLIATIISAAILFWSWPWFSQRSRWWGVLLAGLFVLSPLVIRHTRLVMSEAVFTAAYLALIVLAEQAVQREQGRWWFILTSITLIFVLFGRTVGIILGASVIAYMVLAGGRRLWKDLALSMLGMTAILGIIIIATPVQLRDIFPLWYLNHPDAGVLVGVASQLSSDVSTESLEFEIVEEVEEPADVNSTDILGWIARGVRKQITEYYPDAVISISAGQQMQSLASHLRLPMLPSLIGLLISGLIIVGYIVWIRQEGLSAFNSSAIIYMGVLIVWSWNNSRLLYPILPQLQFSFIVGIGAVFLLISSHTRRVSPQIRNAAIAFIFVAFLVFLSYRSLTIQDDRLHTVDYKARTNWFMTNSIQGSAILLTEQPMVDFMYSLNKTVQLPGKLNSADQLREFLGQNEIDFIVVAPAMKYYPGGYAPEYSDRTSKLLPLVEDLMSNDLVKLESTAENGWIRIYSVDQAISIRADFQLNNRT